MAQPSPMMRQYEHLKEQNKDKILFFRVGDFYEMFFDDAVLASKELELTLTGKDFGLEERAPMCGVPHHSAEAYTKRLIEKGYKVAICEQVEDPALAKGLVQRDVVRVITPGTVVESSMLEDGKNNYISCLYIDGLQAGLCFADISTGTAHTLYLQGEKLDKLLCAELARYMPSEILANGAILEHKSVTGYIKQNLAANVSFDLLDDEDFAQNRTAPLLKEHFGEALDSVVGLPYDAPGFAALGALIGYLYRTQKTGVERLKTLYHEEEERYMRLPPVSMANLELCETLRGKEKKGTLLWVLDKTGTAMGKRLLRRWVERPLMDVEAICARLDAVEELFTDNVQRVEICEELGHVFDIERLLTRVVFGSATPRELTALASTCLRLPGLLEKLGKFSSAELQALRSRLDPLADLAETICGTLVDDPPASLKDGGVIRQGFHEEVDELRRTHTGGTGLLAEIEGRLKEETGIRTLKIGFNKVFGYYIEVSKSFVDQVPDHFVRKQTLTGGERYITEELKTLETRILRAGEQLVVLERELYRDLLQKVAAQQARIQQTADCVARLDVLSSLAQVAVANHYVRPEVNGQDRVEILQGRHPVVEKVLKGGHFVPNDAKLDGADNRMQIITGPNMAGKSTYMRQTALIVILAQIGSFVPAQGCTVGVCDAVFTRVGASDDLAAGKSTFMVEMTEVAEILQEATRDSLVILDEIGRGTST
ncbi:DNA mismatch repair protein MutS, partial [Ruminococcaceae bacterium OttesenSCG-928-I18]|nr:DNA mismatch repair protein MutS [Ruminococcaceae bacterium OttesenSCG-928-I18]